MLGGTSSESAKVRVLVYISSLSLSLCTVAYSHGSPFPYRNILSCSLFLLCSVDVNLVIPGEVIPVGVFEVFVVNAVMRSL